MAKTVAPKKTNGGAVTVPSGDWAAELNRYAQASQKVGDAVAQTGSWVTFRAGAMAFKQLPIKNSSLDIIVLDECLENLYYEDDFDPNAPASPVCFALAREVSGMVPHETSPKKQHDSCAGCPQNAFGSARTGRGKACKNTVRLALIAYGDGSEKQLSTCELAFAKLPVTSTKNWGKYTTMVREMHGRPPLGVVTRMSCRPDPKNQVMVEFEFVKVIDNKLGNALLKRRREAEGALIPEQPYQQIEREAPTPARGKGGKANVPAKRKY